MMNNSSPGKKARPWIIAAIVAGLVVSGFFGFGAMKSLIRMQATRLEPSTTDPEGIRGWMTVPYIAHVYGLEPEEIYRLAGLPPPQKGDDAKSLQKLNKKHFSGRRAELLEKVKEAVRQGLETQRRPQPDLVPKDGAP